MTVNALLIVQFVVSINHAGFTIGVCLYATFYMTCCVCMVRKDIMNLAQWAINLFTGGRAQPVFRSYDTTAPQSPERTSGPMSRVSETQCAPTPAPPSSTMAASPSAPDAGRI